MIELISIGSELLQGKTNTNAAYLGEKLSTIGLVFSRQYTVRDKEEEIESVFKEVLKQAQLIITTGGLGPTFDDLTRKVVSRVLKKRLIFNDGILKRIKAHFSDIGRDMPASSRNQAYIIEGAEIVENRVGTAPGMIVETSVEGKNRTIIMLPGPPAELRLMVEGRVLPYLKERLERGFLKRKLLHVCGLTESEVYDRIKGVVEIERKMEGAELSFSVLAHTSIVDIGLSVQGRDELLVEDILHKAASEIYESIGEYIYGEDGQTLEELIGFKLGKRRETLSVAESCTGGMISNRITNIPGSSLYFKEGVVAYSGESKMKVLGVKEETLKKYGSVSRPTALEMARGIREQMRCDYGLATTGIAGPGGGTIRKPVGMVFIALSKKDKEVCIEFYFSGSRREIKEKVSTAALDLLRKNIQEPRTPQKKTRRRRKKG